MINRLKLALKILLGYNIIVYEENTKIIHCIINGCLDLMNINFNYALKKKNYISENNGELRYYDEE